MGSVPYRKEYIWFNPQGSYSEGMTKKSAPASMTVGHFVMKTDVRADLPRVALRQAPEILLILRITAAQNHHLHNHIS